jgi:hypothetical protein
MSGASSEDQPAGRRRRSDAEDNIERILVAAGQLLAAEPDAGLEEIAERDAKTEELMAAVGRLVRRR